MSRVAVAMAGRSDRGIGRAHKREKKSVDLSTFAGVDLTVI